jgi:hypothetical protein
VTPLAVLVGLLHLVLVVMFVRVVWRIVRERSRARRSG